MINSRILFQFALVLIISFLVTAKGAPASPISEDSTSNETVLQRIEDALKTPVHQSKGSCMCPDKSAAQIQDEVPIVAKVFVVSKESEELVAGWTLDTYQVFLYTVLKDTTGKLEYGKLIEVQSISENLEMNSAFCGYTLHIGNTYLLPLSITNSIAGNFKHNSFHFTRCHYPQRTLFDI